MHVRKARQDGVDALVKTDATTAKELTLSRLRLQPDAKENICFDDQEAILVLLDGEVEFSCEGKSWQARRDNPFTQRASALYLPPRERATIKASAASEVIITTTRCNEQGEPTFVSPEDVTVNQRGKGGYAREVHDIFVNDSQAKRLLLGETFNPPGGWSSFPPHKHDGEDGEPYLEEVYYYRMNPSQGFGYQALYAKDGSLDEAYTVRDGDAVVISRGYHPVAAAPGYGLYYLWVLAGEQRKLALHEDPDHVWVRND